MAADRKDRRGSLARWPWVTVAVVALLGGGSVWMQSSSKQAIAHFDERRAEVRQYFDEHLYLTADTQIARLLESRQLKRQATFLEEHEDSGLWLLSKSRTAYEQSRLEDLSSEALVARASLPPSVYGVASTSDPPTHWLIHAAAHETYTALCLTLIVLLAAGLALENAWGHGLFAFFCLASTAGLALVRVTTAPLGELPWAGSSGLAAALLGAYMALTIRGNAGYYGGLFSGWLLMPLWGALLFGLIHPLWEPGFDRSLYVLHAAGLGAGFAAATLVSALGLERRGDGSRQTKASEVSRVIGKARRAKNSGQEAHAFALLRAEAERTPGDAALVPALWELAKDLGEEIAAAPAVMALALRALRENRNADAAKLWLDLILAGVSPSAEPLTLVRMGEALLDEGHPLEAVAVMRRATELDEPIVSALALRIVKVARDLDPDLTRASAELALADPRLPPKRREELTTLISAAASALGAQASEEAGAASDPSQARAEACPPARNESVDLGGLDPDAISEDELTEFFGADEEQDAGVDAEEVARWNEPGFVEGLDADSTDANFRDDSTDTLAMALGPDAIEDPLDETESMHGVDTAVEFGSPPDCGLKVVNVIPVAFEDRGLVLDVEGQGKTSLSYDRIEAVAAGAIEGISQNAVIVVDLVLNWTFLGGDDMRILRVRCDSFDPRRVVSAETPLDALKLMLDMLISRTGATPLPDPQGARGNPFARFANLSSYEAHVLKGDPS